MRRRQLLEEASVETGGLVAGGIGLDGRMLKLFGQNIPVLMPFCSILARISLPGTLTRKIIV